MKYIVIPNKINEITSRDKFNLIWTYLLIRSNIKDKTNTACIAEKEIAEKMDVKILSVKRYIAKLKDLEFIKVVDKIPANNGYSYNKYQLVNYDSDWFSIDATFLKEDISIKTKAFLILLKSICIKGTNYYRCSSNKFNESELYKEKLHLSHSTFETLFNECIKLGKIKQVGNGFMILDKFLMMDILTIDEKDPYKVIYRNIAVTCIQNNCYYPNKANTKDNKDQRLSKLVAKYVDNTKAIVTDMNKRIKTYPIYIDFNYLAKLLLNETIENKSAFNEYIM